uniref:Uncharacterized protein n=1 Tax=Anas zonorhyncha TaxID=75864 RepID=A0A8B9VR07_9AVES
MQSYQRLPGNALLRGFRVSYKRHVLTMDDLQTLYGPNWLNDQVRGGVPNFLGGPKTSGGAAQSSRRGMGAVGEPQTRQKSGFWGGSRCYLLPGGVMNMYGDLVMDAVPDKV